MNRLNQTCGTIKITLKITVYRAMAVPVFTYEFEISTVAKRQEAKFETAETKFLRNVAGCTRKGQIESTKLGKN
jgi:hypothetical protein